MPKLNLAEQEVVLPRSKEFHEFVNSRPWRAGVKRKIAKDVWPRWPHDAAAGESPRQLLEPLPGTDLEAPGLEFLAEIASGILGGEKEGTQGQDHSRLGSRDGREEDWLEHRVESELGLEFRDTEEGCVQKDCLESRGDRVGGEPLGRTVGESDPSSDCGGGGEEFLLNAGAQLARLLQDKEEIGGNEVPPRSGLASTEATQGDDKLVGTRRTNCPENKWRACQACGTMLRDWSQASRRQPGDEFTCADVGRVCVALGSCPRCPQDKCKCKKKQQLSCFPNPDAYNMPPGFEVEVKFRQGLSEAMCIGTPWLCIWGYCQLCGVTRTMDRRERMQEFLLDHGGHDERWRDLKVTDFDFRIDQGTRDLYKDFSDALKNGQLTYGPRDTLIPTMVVGPQYSGHLQEKIRDFENLLVTGAVMRDELEKRARSLRKRKSSQGGPGNAVRKRSDKKPKNRATTENGTFNTSQPGGVPDAESPEVKGPLSSNGQDAPQAEFSRTLDFYLCSSSGFDQDDVEYPLPFLHQDVTKHRSDSGILKPAPSLGSLDPLNVTFLENEERTTCVPVPQGSRSQLFSFMEHVTPANEVRQLESPESSMEHLVTSCGPNALSVEPGILNANQMNFGSGALQWSDPPESYFAMVPVSQLQETLVKDPQSV